MTLTSVSLTDMSLREFGLEVASSSPAPGGGSVAAYAGVQGYALMVMVCRLTIGKPKFAAVEAEMKALLELGEEKQQILLRLVNEDTEGFATVMEALGLPKESEEEKARRSEALEAATLKAAAVPLRTAEECMQGLRWLPGLLAAGNPNALSDMGVAGLMFKSGLEGALYNVQINALGLKSPADKERLLAQCRALRTEGDELFAKCQRTVLESLA